MKFIQLSLCLLFSLLTGACMAQTENTFTISYPQSHFHSIQVNNCDTDPVMKITRYDRNSSNHKIDAALDCEFAQKGINISGVVTAEGEKITSLITLNKETLDIIGFKLVYGTAKLEIFPENLEELLANK